MTAPERRRVVEQIRAASGVAERRAIRFTGFPSSTMRYRSVRAPQEELMARIRHLAEEHPRWGYRMIHDVLRREGWAVNRKRVQRLYRRLGLAVRRKGRLTPREFGDQHPHVQRNPVTTSTVPE